MCVKLLVMTTSFHVRMLDESGEPATVTNDVDAPLPARFEVRPLLSSPGDEWGFDLFLTLDRVDGELEITRLEVGRPVTGPNVTASTLREVDVSGALAACRIAWGTQVDTARNPGWERPRGEWIDVSVVREWDMIRGLGLDRLRDGKGTVGFPPLYESEDGNYYVPEGFTDHLRSVGPSSDETTQAVAWLYKFAVAYDMAPVTFIQRVLEVPNATASHWVKLARQAGKVPASTRRPRSDRRHV